MRLGSTMRVRRLNREVLHEQRDVLLAVAKGRHLERERGDPVEQLLVEAPLVDHLLEVLGRRADEPERVGRVPQDAHELLLHGRREALEVLQVERPALRVADPWPALAVLAEEAVAEVLLRAERAVDPHELLPGRRPSPRGGSPRPRPCRSRSRRPGARACAPRPASSPAG